MIILSYDDMKNSEGSFIDVISRMEDEPQLEDRDFDEILDEFIELQHETEFALEDIIERSKQGWNAQ
jgi:hypothetical protein